MKSQTIPPFEDDSFGVIPGLEETSNFDDFSDDFPDSSPQYSDTGVIPFLEEPEGNEDYVASSADYELFDTDIFDMEFIEDKAVIPNVTTTTASSSTSSATSVTTTSTIASDNNGEETVAGSSAIESIEGEVYFV